MPKKVLTPMSVRSFANTLKDKNPELGKSLLQDFDNNSFAELAKQKLDLLLGKTGQT